MTKRIIIGDVHGRVGLVKMILEKENPDEVIILGDYFDSFDIYYEDIAAGMQKLVSIRDKYVQDGKQFTMLIGNHDYHYFSTCHESYSGYNAKFYVINNNILKQLISEKKLQYVYYDNVNKTVYSHAGITNTWLSHNYVDFEFINEVNEQKFRFTYMGGGDCYGDTPYSSPIWVRPTSLDSDMYKDKDGEIWTQIVGHTESRSPIINPSGKLYIIDCLGFNWYMVETLDDTGKLIERKTEQL